MSTGDTYPCPACDRQVRPHAAACPGCGQDLAALAALNEVPDACFNAALAAAKQGIWVEALRHLATALHYRPSDVGAWTLLGKVFAFQGRADEAKLCFANAAMRAAKTSPSPGGGAAPGGIPGLGFLRGRQT